MNAKSVETVLSLQCLQNQLKIVAINKEKEARSHISKRQAKVLNKSFQYLCGNISFIYKSVKENNGRLVNIVSLMRTFFVFTKI